MILEVSFNGVRSHVPDIGHEDEDIHTRAAATKHEGLAKHHVEKFSRAAETRLYLQTATALTRLLSAYACMRGFHSDRTTATCQRP